MTSSTDPPFAVWIDGPWNGRQVRAPGDLRSVAAIRLTRSSGKDPFRGDLAVEADDEGVVLGRYVRCGRDRYGRPYYWWAGTTDCPVPNGVILRRVHARFGSGGLELLAQLSVTLGIGKAALAVERVLRPPSTSG